MIYGIDKSLPVPIKDQLKRQIRGMINSQSLMPGQSLPSCNDMSAILSINRNTVATAYAELASEGVLTSNRGAGTIVSKTVNRKSVERLDEMLNDVLIRAKKLGFTSEEITDQFFSSLVAHSKASPQTILMVWCNHLTSREVGERLASELGVKTKRLLVEEINDNPKKAEKALAGADLVVTSLNYIESILPFAEKQGVDVVGIILTPVSRVLNEIVRMPVGTTVGFVCVNNLAAESVCKGVHLSGHVTLKTIWAGVDDKKHLKEMIAKCDVIFATHHVYDQVMKARSKKVKVIHLDLSITDAGIQLIRERLSQVGTLR